MGEIEVCINLRRGNIGVAEEGLNASEIGTALDEMSGEGMTNHVGTHVLMDSGFDGLGFEDLPKHLTRHILSAPCYE